MRGLLCGFGEAVLSTVVTVLILLNALSGIVSSIWLIILGQWRLVGMGILVGLSMPVFWTITVLPLFALLVVAHIAEGSGKRVLVGLLGFLIYIYKHGLIAAWMLLVFHAFTRYASASVPVLLWGYAIVMAPLCYIARHDPPDDVGSILGCLFGGVGYIVLAVSSLLGASLWSAATIVFVLGVLFSFGMGILAASATSGRTCPAANDDYVPQSQDCTTDTDEQDSVDEDFVSEEDDNEPSSNA